MGRASLRARCSTRRCAERRRCRPDDRCRGLRSNRSRAARSPGAHAMKTDATAVSTTRTPIKWRLSTIVLFLARLAPAPWLARMAMSKLEFFHLRSVLVEGTRYLTPEMVMERLALDTMRSVWDDPRPLVAKLRSMPLVADAEISRRLPGPLVV